MIDHQQPYCCMKRIVFSFSVWCVTVLVPLLKGMGLMFVVMIILLIKV